LKWRLILSQFKRPEELDEVRARLPNLTIDIVRRRLPGGEGEQVSVTLHAIPSFEAFARWFEVANPFVFWLGAFRLACLPWLAAFTLTGRRGNPHPGLDDPEQRA